MQSIRDAIIFTVFVRKTIRMYFNNTQGEIKKNIEFSKHN